MRPRTVLRWAIPALAVAAVVIASRQLGVSETVERDGLTFAAPALARALRGNGPPDVRVLESFEDGERTPCRVFLASGVSGIACQERGGWHLRVIRNGVSLDDPAAASATERILRRAAEQMAAQ